MDWPVDDLGLTVLVRARVSCSPPESLPCSRGLFGRGDCARASTGRQGVFRPSRGRVLGFPWSFFPEASVGRLLDQRAPEATTLPADMCVFLV